MTSQGRELTDNNILLKDIPRMANASGGVFNMSRQQANAQRPAVNVQAAQLNEVAQHLNRVRTLQRNFHACVKGAQLNKDANRHPRHNQPGKIFIGIQSESREMKFQMNGILFI